MVPDAAYAMGSRTTAAMHSVARALNGHVIEILAVRLVGAQVHKYRCRPRNRAFLSRTASSNLLHSNNKFSRMSATRLPLALAGRCQVGGCKRDADASNTLGTLHSLAG